jgi:hypothetical protein
MALLTKKNFTVGNVRQYYVEYCDALRDGDWLTAAAVTSSMPSATISGVAIIEGHKITFFVSGGVINEDFTVAVVATSNTTEVSNDTINFHVIAP